MTALYRAIGSAEFALLVRNAFTEIPAGVSIEPVLYVTPERIHAEWVAREWMATDAGSGYVGYVTRLEVQSRFLARYPIRQTADGRPEYWIPVEHIGELNASIVGPIEVVAEFRPGTEERARS
ncbi:MAG: hypothetical protein H0X68_08895 [Chloroflexi bacterium]|nr:hypothetical protein [Chloroflexota bacterium]